MTELRAGWPEQSPSRTRPRRSCRPPLKSEMCELAGHDLPGHDLKGGLRTVAVRIAENPLTRLAVGVTRGPEGHQSAHFVIEMMAWHGQDEILALSSSLWIYSLTVPGDFCSAGRRLDGGFFALIPHKRPSEYLAPEQPNGSSAIARHLPQRTASGQIGVPVFDHTELVPDHVGHGGVTVLRYVTAAPKPRPELQAHRDGVPLITGSVSEMKVEAILLLAMRSAGSKSEAHLS